MKLSRTIGLAACAFCIIALMVAAASAAETPGQGAQNGKNTPSPGLNSFQAYTMYQTLSDQAQQNTIAFDALAFMTGDSCSDTFLPPGKVADYAGFQYLRDNDPTQMGHNTDFVTRISDNVLYIMNDDQLKQFAVLSETEAPLSTQFGYLRYPLTTAFRANLEENIPSGSSGLNRTAVMEYSAKLYDVDASISIARAKTYASVIRSMNQTQLAYLDRMKSTGMAAMPVVDTTNVLRESGQGNSVAMRTYASEMFAWYAGSIEADTYFCPERQATYFGSFYMKDRPAIGNAGYSISTSLTGESGAEFLSLLTDAQREKITGLVDLQQADLSEIVITRKAIATELRRPLTGGTIDENAVRTLSERYGELDGEISYYYATHFADVGTTLTIEQKEKMIALRNLSGYTCNGAYLYSQPISMPQNIPSGFLFGSGTYDVTAMTGWIQSQQQTFVSENQDPRKSGQGSEAGNETRKQGGRVPNTGNATLPGPRSGPGQNTQGQGPVNAGNTTLSGERRMPNDAIIYQLGQKGYNISGAATAIQSGDREAQKAWLDTFRKNNPGVAEAIESSAVKNNPDRNGKPGASDSRETVGGADQPAQKSIFDTLKEWFSRL